MSDPFILDVIVSTFSQNFQRAVLYKVNENDWAWQKRDVVINAIKETILNLKAVITGADDIIDELESMMTRDTAYKAPEQGGELSSRFRWFRDEVVARNPKIVVPVTVPPTLE